MNRCSVATSSCCVNDVALASSREQPEIVEQLLQKILGREQRIADDRDEGPRLEVLNENPAEHRLARADFAGDDGERLASSQGEGDLFKSRRVRLALKRKRVFGVRLNGDSTSPKDPVRTPGTRRTGRRPSIGKPPWMLELRPYIVMWASEQMLRKF